MPNILTQAYFTRPTLIVARSLIGKYLIRENGRGTIVGKIVEVEAYVGAEDKACHASKGRTARTEVLFGPPGISYVYLIYGMYHMLNVVTERADFPAAVLIRAIEVDGELIDGPGKLCRELGIDRSLHRVDLTEGRAIWFEDRGRRVSSNQVGTFPRIGVDYAGLWAKKPWRFRLIGEDGGMNSSHGKHKTKGKPL
ncbi:MAG TPA: DNA-3-methyladenine glycosylase [Nitrospira sp.]|nr:DNA-3-methyladenine glycosylase [Nitrospira sp.]